ncbi:MAG: hypothetical protein JO061_00450 [Acidobacteriaceae bacterium]|nr:hypothetical protein [Acidobacteriaceae bacterium]
MAKAEPKYTALKIALVGSDTLLGREIVEILEQRIPGLAVSGFSATGEGNFSDHEDEAIYLHPLESQALKGQQAILLAGAPEGAKKAYELAKADGGRPVLIDCLGQLENQPEARIVAPLIGEASSPTAWLQVVAHPAANAIALLLVRLARLGPIRQCVAHVFEPASERGKKGVSELHQQTTSLLSFKSLDKHVFDAQLTFNLLSKYGQDAPDPLSGVEQRIERDLATLLSRQRQLNIPMPSLRLIQAPVFHGYSISLWLEFDRNTTAVEVEQALASASIEVRGETDEAPDSVGAASQSGLIAGDIRIDRNDPRAVWIWAVGDNLRLTADAAEAIVAQLRPPLPQ